MTDTSVEVDGAARGGLTRATPPPGLRAACLLFLAAVLAGVVETVIHVGAAASAGGVDAVAGFGPGILVRAGIYTAVVAVVAFLWRGRRWAQVVLGVGLGVVGVASLVIEPIRWLAAGGDVASLLATADGMFAATAATRGVHLVAVLAGLVLLFTPSVNRYLGSR